jgi:hypothetical protein
VSLGVPALVVARDRLDLGGVVQGALSDARAERCHLALPGLAHQVFAPERPAAALLGARGVDRATAIRSLELAAREVAAQRDAASVQGAVALEELGPAEAALGGQGDEVGLAQEDKGVGPAVRAAASAALALEP